MPADRVEALVRQEHRAQRFVGAGRVCVQCGAPRLDVAFEIPLKALPKTVRARFLQRHHVARRRSDALTVPVCPTCHEALDLRQYDWPTGAQRGGSPQEKRAALLCGVADLLDARSEIDRKIADRLRALAVEGAE